MKTTHEIIARKLYKLEVDNIHISLEMFDSTLDDGLIRTLRGSLKDVSQILSKARALVVDQYGGVLK